MYVDVGSYVHILILVYTYNTVSYWNNCERKETVAIAGDGQCSTT